MKIKIKSTNHTQQSNVINKCRKWGSEARDGNYGPVPGKTAVVVNTKLGGGTPALQLSNVNFTPTKSPYDKVFSYKEFMNLTDCPWGANKATGCTDSHHNVCSETQTTTIVVPVPVPVEAGVCSQETLKVADCTALVQEDIAWKTLGLPFLQDAGIEVTMAEDVAYIINTRKNTAKPLTAKSAAKKAKKDLIAGKDSAWVRYAKEFNLYDAVQMVKDTEGDDNE